jgi:hypothetical protein
VIRGWPLGFDLTTMAIDWQETSESEIRFVHLCVDIESTVCGNLL